ncbi:MAG: pilin [Patescibacteria group bacterium]|jgi:hypothetical protein|nr:pilin [Patescibacteria group bacterium]
MFKSKKNNVYKFLALSLVLVFSLSFFNVVLANNTSNTGSGGGEGQNTGSGGGEGQNTPPSDNLTIVSLDNPIGSDDIPLIIGRVISAVLGIVGSLSLLMFVYGGFTWMTAAGNEQNITKGKNIVIWATVGIFIVFFSYALIKFLFSSLGV